MPMRKANKAIIMKIKPAFVTNADLKMQKMENIEKTGAKLTVDEMLINPDSFSAHPCSNILARRILQLPWQVDYQSRCTAVMLNFGIAFSQHASNARMKLPMNAMPPSDRGARY